MLLLRDANSASYPYRATRLAKRAVFFVELYASFIELYEFIFTKELTQRIQYSHFLINYRRLSELDILAP